MGSEDFAAAKHTKDSIRPVQSVLLFPATGGMDTVRACGSVWLGIRVSPQSPQVIAGSQSTKSTDPGCGNCSRHAVHPPTPGELLMPRPSTGDLASGSSVSPYQAPATGSPLVGPAPLSYAGQPLPPGARGQRHPHRLRTVERLQTALGPGYVRGPAGRRFESAWRCGCCCRAESTKPADSSTFPT